MTAASLHLAAILARAEHNTGYITFYNQQRVLYSTEGINLSEQLRARLEACVDRLHYPEYRSRWQILWNFSLQLGK